MSNFYQQKEIIWSPFTCIIFIIISNIASFSSNLSIQLPTNIFHEDSSPQSSWCWFILLQWRMLPASFPGFTWLVVASLPSLIWDVRCEAGDLSFSVSLISPIKDREDRPMISICHHIQSDIPQVLVRYFQMTWLTF